AGHDTTAFALAVGLYFLCKNPEIQEKARQEALAVFGKPGADKRVPITHEQLKQIPFIESIIKEAMRYYPSVSRLPSRINQVELEVNGITIPKNQILTLEMIHFSRSAKYWENPDEFDPYRFYNTTTKDMKHSFAWSTFGGGQRLCIGKDFS
ncbi:cytochrome P450, partial [Conidiobolus coronatus NRRL 28638]